MLSPPVYDEPGGPHRLAAVDGLRGIAILLVVLYHLWLVSWYAPHLTVAGHDFDSTPFAATGFLGVELFFFISGFCLFYPYAQTLFDGRRRQTLREFTWRRFIKIVPSYVLVMVVLVAAGDAIGVRTWTDAVRHVGLHLIFLHTWFGDTYGSIAGVLWSLGVEVQFYAMFPVLCWLAMRYPLPTFAAMFLEALGYRIFFAQDPAVIGPRISQVFAVLDLFGAGMLAAYLNRALSRRLPRLAKQRVVWTLVAIVALVAFAVAMRGLYAGMTSSSNFVLYDERWRIYNRSLLALAFCVTTVGSLAAFGLWQRLLGNAVLGFLSTISYNLYLWHQVVADWMADHHVPRAATPNPHDDPAYATAAFVVHGSAALVIATVVTYAFERPLLRLRPPWRWSPPRTWPSAAFARAAPLPARLRARAFSSRPSGDTETTLIRAPVRERAAVAGIVALLAIAFNRLHASAFNNYTYLADAFVHGRLWIQSPDAYMSAVTFGGHPYIIEPVMPAVLMLPLAVVAGDQANQTLLSVVMLAVASGACWSLVRRIGLSVPQAIFVVAVMVFATSAFYSGAMGDVWEVTSVCALAFTFLLLDEVAGRNRPWLVGVYAVGAAFSRYALLPTVAVYGVMGYAAFGRRYAGVYGLTLLPFLAAAAGYNEGRWGTLWDHGYRLYETQIYHREVPLFGLDNVRPEAASMFLKPLVFTGHAPWIATDRFGVGVVYTSAVFAGALLAPLRLPATRALWLLVAITLIPNLLYYDSGDFQFGFRHVLDFVPFLVALLALGMRAYRSWLLYALGALEIAFGIVQAYIFRALYVGN